LVPLNLGQAECNAGDSLSGIISDDLQFLNIMSNRSMSLLASQVTVPCDSFISAASLTLFGVSPFCTFPSLGVLQIRFSANASIAIGATVFFHSWLFDDQVGLASAATKLLKCPVLAPLNPIAVRSIMQAPQQVGFCDPITIDGSSSEGNVYRPWIVNWTLVSAVPRLATAQIQGITRLLDQASLTKQLVITFVSDQLPAGQTYTFGLALSNWIFTIGYSTVTVVKSSSPLLPIRLSANAVQSVVPSSAVELTASTVLSLKDSCFDASMVSSFLATFAWGQVMQVPPQVQPTQLRFPLSEMSLSLASFRQPTATLQIPALTFGANQTYIFQVIFCFLFVCARL
jgi:hypothetical protein